MSEQAFEPVTLLVNVLYKGEVIAAKYRLSNDELFSLREGPFNMGEQLKSIAGLAVKEAFDSDVVKEMLKAKNA